MYLLDVKTFLFLLLSNFGIFNALSGNRVNHLSSIEINFASSTDSFSQSWPKGIKFLGSSLPRFGGLFNTPDYPYFQTGLGTEAAAFPYWLKDRRKFDSQETTIITMELPELRKIYSRNGIPMVWVPPLPWIKSSLLSESCGIRVYQRRLETVGSERRLLEITAPSTILESNVATLRQYEFDSKAIFRMTQRAPWLLAVDLPNVLAKTVPDLKKALHVLRELNDFDNRIDNSVFSTSDEGEIAGNSTDIIHILSHCPFILMQSYNQPGKDYRLLLEFLLDQGYTSEHLRSDILRFPSLLTTSVERLVRWKKILDRYSRDDNISRSGNLRTFSSLLRQTPYLFYLDPPSDTLPSISLTHYSCDAQNPDEDELAGRIVDNLDYLASLGLPDLDKIIRTGPEILLLPLQELSSRISVLMDVVSQGLITAGERVNTTPRKKNKGWQFTRSPVLHSSAISTGDSKPELRLAPLWMNYLDRYQKNRIREQEMLNSSSTQPTTQIDLYFKLPTEVDSLVLKENDVARNTVFSILESNPSLFRISHNEMMFKMIFLEKYGFHARQILDLLKRCPAIFQLSISRLQGNLFYFQQTLGFSQRQLISIVREKPPLLLQDTSVLQLKMEYLNRIIGWNFTLSQSASSNYLVKCLAQYLLLPFDRVIVPRCEYLYHTRTNQSQHLSRSFPSLVGLLSLPDDHEFCKNARIEREDFDHFSRNLL